MMNAFLRHSTRPRVFSPLHKKAVGCTFHQEDQEWNGTWVVWSFVGPGPWTLKIFVSWTKKQLGIVRPNAENRLFALVSKQPSCLNYLGHSYQAT